MNARADQLERRYDALVVLHLEPMHRRADARAIDLEDRAAEAYATDDLLAMSAVEADTAQLLGDETTVDNVKDSDEPTPAIDPESETGQAMALFDVDGFTETEPERTYEE